MSVLNPERNKVAPRSALRYRPIGADQATRPGPGLTRKPPRRADARSITPAVVSDDLEDEEEERVPPWRHAVPRAPRQAKARPGRAWSRLHPLFFVGVGLLFAVLLWIGVTQVIAWGNGVLDLLHYGNPRTYQTDAVVGQGDSLLHPSHFVALNLRGQVVILDFPAGDPARAREFTVSSVLGPHAEQVVVTLRFVDVDHTGKPDMIIEAGGAQTFLVNAAGTFRPPTPAEQQQILRALSL
jgi:hypothetical protein